MKTAPRQIAVAAAKEMFSDRDAFIEAYGCLFLGWTECLSGFPLQRAATNGCRLAVGTYGVKFAKINPNIIRELIQHIRPSIST